ncbi:biotin carboxyl carrier protein of acetyl-coa carboxylase 1 [Quercus suber]|uniref:Biotin carboxyl carrier protein of acetyl-coa carboxylase 1 n=1 Tax=Quercus suber TaxID=58331 RepID=A0AAW0JQ62_QUESU
MCQHSHSLLPILANHIYQANYRIKQQWMSITKRLSLGSLGALNIRFSSLDFGRARVDERNSHDFLCSPINKNLLFDATASGNVENDSEETKISGLTNQLIPNSSEVESLLTKLCDTTSIAEFELKLDGFRLYVMRDLNGKIESLPSQIPTPVSVSATAEAPGNGSVSTSLVISKPVPSSGSIQTLLEKAADEGLAILKSPRVGCFRRSRTIKGKRAPPPCKEKQIVKEGQVLCYIEQLGGELPIESDVSGEVIKILREDGDPVGYGDALIAILPSFPGIKKLHYTLQALYALAFTVQLCDQHTDLSDVSGEVIKILREDGDPVGYGDALIAILPSFPGIKKLQ